MSLLELDGVSKVFEDGTLAVETMDLQVSDGEFMVLVGPSGSGKTTVLRLVAGLEEATHGTIRIGGRDVTGLPPHARDIAMVFQNYALYPQMTVAENMGFALKLAGVPKMEIRRRVVEAAQTLDLEGQLRRRPRQLSGGQRQRVAMGRAIVREPTLFLMDEPLSNLDAQLRVQMRAEIRQLQLRLRVTTLYVTHDQTEAMTMGDRVAVLRHGRIEQMASPRELYERPANLFVAGFIGSPAMNTLRGTLEGAEGGLVFRSGGLQLSIPEGVLAEAQGIRPPTEIVLGIRPEDLHPQDPDAPSPTAIRGTVLLTEQLGMEAVVHLAIDARDALVPGRDVDPSPNGHRTATVPSTGSTGGMRLLARLEPGAPPAVGRPLSLAPDPSRIYVFDPQTGDAIRGPVGIPSPAG